MKIGELDIVKWTWNGSELNSPVVILWRAMLAPIYYIMVFGLYIVILLMTGSKFYADEFLKGIP